MMRELSFWRELLSGPLELDRFGIAVGFSDFDFINDLSACRHGLRRVLRRNIEDLNGVEPGMGVRIHPRNGGREIIELEADFSGRNCGESEGRDTIRRILFMMALLVVLDFKNFGPLLAVQGSQYPEFSGHFITTVGNDFKLVD